MDYSKLSDFEINKRVAICIHPEIRDWNCYDVSGRACFVINENTPKRVQFGFSFTTNPADAWPIIEKNKITLIYEDGCDPCALSGVKTGQCFEVEFKHWAQGGNALRNAMIVFLMMQESQNA
ncbi:phage protein NinX family protein [Cronobacter dublinensis]|uniref:phage protein NinX family protein n=1 Tax=Cronobacter dublinensis TaxID=413497 RepID=UPI000CFB6788|nr:phage protein NinX family protein [Cronobacter dublinensis]